MLYDNTDPKSIEEYGKKMIGKTFQDLINSANLTKEEVAAYSNKKRKGGLGNLIEEVYFEYKANSDRSADFSKAGVELKATPYQVRIEKRKNQPEKKILTAGERLVLTMIENTKPVVEDFFASHLWQKCKLMLLVFYLRNKDLPSNLEYMIDFVKLFTPPEDDLRIITEDYNTIITKIKSGLAHELSEGDTKYLGACTKGATAKKSLASQYYNPDIPAKRRAFSFKTSYMTYILNNYIANAIGNLDNYTDESIITANSNAYSDRSEIIQAYQDKLITFDDYIVKLIDFYKGIDAKKLCSMFQLEYKDSKALYISIAYRILGIRSNQASEFLKANIVVKATRVTKLGRIVESSPFPTFKFDEIVKETWDESTLKDYLETTKFLFVVFQENEDGKYILQGSKFWNMPMSEIEQVEPFWTTVRNMIRDDKVELMLKQQSNGVVVENNFPKKKDNPFVHIRPHASKSYNVLKDGTIYGKGKISDSDLLPNGTRMTKQCFWLNNNYLEKVLQDLIDL